jgi:hypothetical protein
MVVFTWPTASRTPYSPVFDATDGPFRVGGAPGSHSVALTSRRLLISRDPHGGTGRRSVRSIDLGSVRSMEIGSALTLAWFAVRFAGPEGPGACPVLFSPHGLDHFRSIVRGYLSHEREEGSATLALERPGVWRDTPAFLRGEVAPLTRATDPPLAVLHTAERWARGRPPRSRPARLSAAGLLAATPLGLLWAVSEPRTRPDGLSFGVNVTAVRSDRVADASITCRAVHGTTLTVLRVRVGDEPVTTEMEVPIDERDRPSAEKLVRPATSWRSGP